MTCPICKAPSVGTKPCPGYCEGVEDGRAGEVYAVLYEDEGDARFSDINDGSAGHPRDAQRAIGTREQAVAHQAEWGGKVVRVVPDGAHDAVEDGREHEWQESETGHTRCVRCGVPHKLSALRDFPHCPKMGAAERAILERDIAEVERALENLGGEALAAQMDAQNAADDVDFCMQMGDSMADRQWWEASAEDYRAHALREQERSAKASALARYRFAMLADCEAWLVRARAALGGGA